MFRDFHLIVDGSFVELRDLIMWFIHMINSLVSRCSDLLMGFKNIVDNFQD